MAIPRLNGLALSPAGDRLVATVSHLDDTGAKFVSSVFALDPGGAAPARRLTRSAEGESAASFLPDGSLLFVSKRPRPSDRESAGETWGGEDEAALWLLPAEGGEAFVVASKPGGITAVATGARSTTVVVGANTAPGSPDAETDRRWWEDRRKKKVSASLYDGLPVRHWDHYLGPAEVHLYALDVETRPGSEKVAGELRDLTPHAGQALHDAHAVLSPDGSTVVVDWMVRMSGGHVRNDLVAIDVATGELRTLAAFEDGSYDFEHPEISPDGRHVVALRSSRATPTEPQVLDLWLVDMQTGSSRPLDVGDEAHPQGACFNAEGTAVIVAADCGGRGPLFEIEIETGDITRLTGEGAFGTPEVALDGSALFTLRAAVDEPPRAVRLDRPTAAPVETNALAYLDAPGALSQVPGRVEEVLTEAADGTQLRAWLVLPPEASEASPAPLALFVHGGPLNSWNTWHWRWNPWLLAARGWAVLLPDPALSTGYGMKMIRRGWGQWGGAPFDDLMEITDAALARPDLDAQRTAALGGSYGGYMANWIAGHTDRFRAIVSHASLWSLEQFLGTTDWPAYWADEWGYPDTNPELYEKWSPDRSADRIRTPVLVIHGDRDYRCPVGESLRLWSDLVRRGVAARFLFFADENHWILQPGDGVVWYETVFAFLDEHVLGGTFARPRLA
jgi:dipeptidyl aminopeptidase/acylaminoacyl peptidase